MANKSLSSRPKATTSTKSAKNAANLKKSLRDRPAFGFNAPMDKKSASLLLLNLLLMNP